MVEYTGLVVMGIALGERKSESLSGGIDDIAGTEYDSEGKDTESDE
jgi:hypothetical protein